MTSPSLPPLGDEDKVRMAQTIQWLVRCRKRQAATGLGVTYLSDAIEALRTFGIIRGWWSE